MASSSAACWSSTRPRAFARVGIALVSALWLLWTAGRGQGRIREAVALAALSTLGSMLMTEAREIVTLVLAIELATMPAYVLIGYRRDRTPGLEGALKYFLLSVLTTLVMLYGLSFLYGLTGTTMFDELDLSGAGTLGLLAVVLTYVGMFAKLSAAPFHYWAPDAYEGAEAWTVAFVSTVPKIAGGVAIVRLTAALAPSAPGIGIAIVAVAAASMVLGNLAALGQTDLRRMMAYSGVAHTGYLLLGVGALSVAGFGSAVFYALAYALPSLGIMLLAAEEGSGIAELGGLHARRPLVAWATVLMLVSLVGIPPLVGFFGKLYLFVAALGAGLSGWVVLAVVMSVVSAAYYLRVVRSMFFGEAPSAEPSDRARPRRRHRPGRRRGRRAARARARHCGRAFARCSRRGALLGTLPEVRCVERVKSLCAVRGTPVLRALRVRRMLSHDLEKCHDDTEVTTRARRYRVPSRRARRLRSARGRRAHGR